VVAQDNFRSPAVTCSPALLFKSEDRVVAFMFEKLEVYQKAVDLADKIASLTEAFPRGYGFLVDQLNRAAVFIATNLAEGNGRFTVPDRRNFFTIARGSTQECVPLIEIARRRGSIQETASLALRERLEVIAKMLSGLINGLDRRKS
jgi:four helix bundle protein